MKKILYIVFSIGVMLGSSSCEDNDYESILSFTDDYISETGGDYYGGEGIDVSMYEKARIFPGLVDTLTEARLAETQVEIDLSKRPVGGNDVNWTIAPASIYSTGLYAGAGEKITIDLNEDIKGLSIQIGVHSTDLTSLIGNGYVERDAKVVTTMPLFEGTNEIRSPYGGYIWIRRSGKGGVGKTQLLVKGAYAAPDYIKGKTEDAEWIEKIKATTVPWIELRGENVAFTVPTKYIRKKISSLGSSFAANVRESLELWDDWMKCIYEFYGLDGVEEDFPVPGYPTRAIMDVHLITERYSYYNDDVVELLETEEMIDMITDPEIIKTGGTNTVHLMGWLQLEKYSQIYTPSTVNLSGVKTIYSLIPNLYFLMKNNWWNGKNYEVQSYSRSANIMRKGTSYELNVDEIEKFVSFASVSDTCKDYNQDIDNLVESSSPQKASLVFVSDIINYKQGEKDGWKFWGYFNRYIKTIREEPGHSMAKFEDVLLHALTEYFDRDFTPLFDHWGIEVSDFEENLARQKEMIDKCIWQHNPLSPDKVIADYDGRVGYTLSGKRPYHHDRANWVAVAYSGKETTWAPGNYRKESMPANLFDGRRNTWWESYYDAYQVYADEDGVIHYPFKGEKIYEKAQTPELPYTLIISPGNGNLLSRMEGFYLAYGNTLESSIYNTDVPDYDYYSFGPQHIIVEVTTTPLEYDESDEDFYNLESANWEKVYDSDEDTEPARRQFKPELLNKFYIDLPSGHQTVRAIRLTFDRNSHTAKDRPAGWNETVYPGRPAFTNKNLDRIQKIAEFGTYYY